MPVKNITVSKYDAYLAKIMSENSKLTQNTNEENTNFNSKIESLKEIVTKKKELERIYDEKYVQYQKKFEECQNNDNNYDDEYYMLEKEVNEMTEKLEEYHNIITNNIPKDSEEKKNVKQYYDEVINIINRFQTTIDDPKNLSLYFIELLMILDSNQITYKNRLIFLKEFQKHLNNKDILIGIIYALENRQKLIRKYNMKFDIKEQNLDVDMGLCIYIHKKYPQYTIDAIYNSFLNNLIYKYNVNSVVKYEKSKINDENEDSCRKYSMYYKILKYLNDFNEPDINKFDEYLLNIK